MRIPSTCCLSATSRRPRQRLRFSTCNVIVSACALLLAPSCCSALQFPPAPAANLDLAPLGRIGIAGDFAGISLYEFEAQVETRFAINSSQSLLARLPNGALVPVASTDASINDMCLFVMSSGQPVGLVLGGSFTSLDGTPSQAVALFNTSTAAITPLAGLSGQVNAILCDNESDTVYVGGNFIGPNTTNAVAWYGTEGWTNLPFSGFNGPVTSISKASNGHIIFGGTFTGLGNASTPITPDSQTINLSTANITAGSTNPTPGFDNPHSVICNTGPDGPGRSWLLQDGSPGFWQANLAFGFEPTKLRLWNTHQNGRGTKTWRFTALRLDGILNFTYTDPATGRVMSCTNQCPLSQDPSVEFQDFHFVNVVGMNSFRIDISDHYGPGGGLNGVALFADRIVTYAINDYNEPSCRGILFPSTAISTGPWVQAPSGDDGSPYVTASLSGGVNDQSVSISFFPNIRQSGYYSIEMYTPGCIQDGTCMTRGQVNITGLVKASSPSGSFDFFTNLYQTNNFEKYDQIYFGFIDGATSDFRPHVTLMPLAGQSLAQMTIVAQQVGFTLINSTGGLNGLYDFDPTMAQIDTADFKASAINTLGGSFGDRSAVFALASSNNVTYIAGNFSSSLASNIIAIDTQTETVSHLDGGLNGAVSDMKLHGSDIFVAGTFTDAQTGNVPGLNHVAFFDTAADTWHPLGAGVDGAASRVVAMSISLDGNNSNETVFAFSGEFSRCISFANYSAISVDGFAVWVPSRANWLQNLIADTPFYYGVLSASLLGLPTGDDLYAGSITSSSIASSSAAYLSTQGLTRLPVKIDSSPSTIDATSVVRRHDSGPIATKNVSGVVTGSFYDHEDNSYAILAGHFSIQGPDNQTIRNLAVVQDGGSGTLSGFGQGTLDEGIFVTVGIVGTTLFAGGSFDGVVGGVNVVGLVAYDLGSNMASSQPPSLSPANSTVSAIAVQGTTGDVYVGGSFERAGSLDCSGVCYYQTSLAQWKRPGDLGGSAKCLLWASDTTLLAGGELILNQTTGTALASYDTATRTWTAFPKAQQLPGPVELLTLASSDGDQIWVSGISTTSNAPYLMKYDGSSWLDATHQLGAGTRLTGLQMFSLTQSHDQTDLVAADEVLLLTGSIVISGYGTASSALFNGTAIVPYALTTGSAGSAGSISRIFTERQPNFTSSGGGLALVLIILISLAISLALVLILVLFGFVLDRVRKRREGYMPAPASMYDRGTGIRRIPPQQLLESLGRDGIGVPHV